MIRRPPRSPLFPFTPLFRPVRDAVVLDFEPEAVGPEQPGEPLRARLRLLVIPLAQVQGDLAGQAGGEADERSEEHTSELQSPWNIVCRLLLEKKKQYLRSER